MSEPYTLTVEGFLPGYFRVHAFTGREAISETYAFDIVVTSDCENKEEIERAAMYEQEIALVAGDDLEPSQILANLGYEGEGDDPRSLFEADYGSSDDATIAEVHETGRERGVTT